ncbi:amidase [SAR202 cluster bacterium AC-647-P02_OGT_505m]|nr:amidase [SAR202 cluster bacterium AC-647-P02_OGT_505m]
MSIDVNHSSAVDIGKAIASNEITSKEAVENCIERINKINPSINALVQDCFERALSEADSLDIELAQGINRGPLHGVPMTLKDSLNTEGVITTWATLGRQNEVPEADATLVSRLREAGSILLGKTNTPELTLAADTDNLVYGRTKNPYDTNLSPGGSSGGAAAIIATGGSPFDIGSDTGGSIRIPAHSCGIAGIKPTSGRVPRTGHCISYALGATESLTQNGPMARYVRDLNPILKVISGPDFKDPYIVPMPIRDPSEIDIKGMRIAFHTDNGLMSPTQEISNVVRNVASALQDKGAATVEILPDPIRMLKQIDGRNGTGDGREWVRRILKDAGTNQFSPFIENRLEEAPAIPTSEFTEVLEMVDHYRSGMIQFMKDFDVILCPASAKPAVGPGESFLPENKFLYSYTSAFNVTGWPAGVVRGGTSSSNLPIAVQVVGKPWREDIVLSVLETVEEITGGWIAPTSVL